ncbi:AraC family transcriptional regulator [Flavobacterium aquidurense]|uniref:helix-turn-helix domain-containing protein n=1 Tax=Flavobacterium aquidurense TaxID=362413 RepID=UPI00285B4A32|nr:AraC family transcriptional regulator [Flavobacterium aquidurense]MDR7371727.1 AraC-like DNA-binding protein [Flavobacterium aquidurense]
MKTIQHSFGADLDWIESFAKEFGGSVEGNFINTPENISTGVRYFLDTGEEDVVILYIDVTYHSQIHIIQSHLKKDFIGLYFNLIQGKTFKTCTDFSYDIGSLGYDVSIIDSLLESDYYVSPGTKSYGICIFIKKLKIEYFAKKNKNFSANIDKIMDTNQNTFIKFDHMSPEIFNVLRDLRKQDVGGELFNLNLIATGYELISNYLDQMFTTDIIEKVNKDDLMKIIGIQAILIENIDKPFPSIKTISDKAHMSETKFKKLFKKITGTTPNYFYMSNKLKKAKELLETKKNTITEVCEQLNFSNYSYFIFKFREYFGVSPNTFIKKL